jgi:hypothetical protein
MSRALRLAALLIFATAGGRADLPAQEVQQHGLAFEQWVRTTFFGGYRPRSYTQKWDIPAEINRDYGGVPVNPKAIKHGAPIDLGDATRQYGISEPFILLIGFWQQEGDTKRFTNFAAPRVTPEQWAKLWAPITYADLLKLDTLIKDPALPIEETRRLALRMKNSPPFNQAIMQVNPKIDARQRRLQCSLRFNDFFRHLATDADPKPQAAPTLWGVPFPAPLASPPRHER